MRWIDGNGHFFQPPLIVDGMAHHSPTPELLLAAGYTPYTKERKLTQQTFKFDRYKIVTFLGDGWAAKKAELEEAGLYDKFMSAPYLSTGDPLFRKVWVKLTAEEKKLLIKNCQYGHND